MRKFKQPRDQWRKPEFWKQRMFRVAHDADPYDGSFTTKIYIIAFFRGLTVEYTRPWDPKRR